MRKHPLDKGSFWIIVAVTIITLAASFYDLSILHWEFYDSMSFYYLGIILFILGYALRIYSRITLQKQFSVFVALQKEHMLITTGVYNYVRHPIYTAAIISFVGFFLITNSLLGLVVGFVLGFPALLYRIHIEEKMLIAHFGQEYINYKKRVKALIPWLI
jgi:protein-S-isoprenylcysteine O-methyltransferase Ste14